MRLRHIAVGYDGSSAQRAAPARARAELPDGLRVPAVGTEVVPADPVTALCRAARQADLLVLGSDRGAGLDARSVPGRVAARLGADRRHERAPLVVIAGTGGGVDAGADEGGTP